jgi:hypothetical protein
MYYVQTSQLCALLFAECDATIKLLFYVEVPSPHFYLL